MPGFMDNSFMGDRSPEAAVGGETQMNWMPGGSTAPAPQTSKQTSGGFFGVASQAARTIPLMTGAANAAAGVASSSIAAPLGAFGPGAFVVGNVLFSLARTVFGFGKKKTPNAVFRSTPVGNTNNFEKGWYVQSQLGNIGFEDAGTKNIPDEQAFIDLAKGVASLDDVVAPYLGTKAVEKIRSGFAFQPPTLMPSEGLIEHRYISMLDFASDVSPAAKKARQTLNDAYQDYAIAEQSINKVVSQKYAPQEEAKEEQGLMDYSGEWGPGSEETEWSQEGLRKRAEQDRIQSIRQTLQSTPDHMQEVVDEAYISYVDSGGIMGPEQFESAFSRNLQDSLQE